MFSAILVPLDGSKFAEAALAPATYLAKISGARVYLTTARARIAVMAGGEPALVPSGVLQAVQRDEETYLADTASKVDLAPGSVRFSLVEGLAGEAVCDEAGRNGADVIVMATHGRGAIGRLWLGGVANHVVKHAGRPVLLIHPHLAWKPLPDGGFRTILVALDPSDYSESILNPVVTLARLSGAQVVLLTVIAPVFGIAEPQMPPPLSQHPGIVARRSDEAHARLELVAADLRARGIETGIRVAVASTPAAGILSVLSEDRFDVLAMTTHGRRGVERLLVGSVAETVMRSAPKPLLIYHPTFG